jgi:hypothetical protein
MNEALAEVAMHSENSLQMAERSCQIIRSKIHELKKFIHSYTFKDQDEEILFFKEIKPQFIRELIYFTELFYIEANKPMGDKIILEAYYRQIIHRNRIYFDRNQGFYVYYLSGKTIYDSLYFLRESDEEPLNSEYMPDIDLRFSTIHSFKLGKLQAFENLQRYLNNAISLLYNSEGLILQKNDKHVKNRWTDSKAALIELVYALHSRGSINNGKGDVKQIVTGLESFFNVQVGNFYRTFQSMRIRKKNRTVYLDTLKESLERRMDETDLNF